MKEEKSYFNLLLMISMGIHLSLSMYLWSASDVQLMSTTATVCIVLSGINLFAVLVLTIVEFLLPPNIKINLFFKSFLKII